MFRLQFRRFILRWALRLSEDDGSANREFVDKVQIAVLAAFVIALVGFWPAPFTSEQRVSIAFALGAFVTLTYVWAIAWLRRQQRAIATALGWVNYKLARMRSEELVRQTHDGPDKL